MASNEDEREHRLRAVWVPTIQPLTSDELNERLASMLELHGETMASYEEKVRAQGLTLQCVGLNHDSSTTVPSSGSSPAISPNSSNEHSSGGATTTTEPDASDCDFVPEMKADIQKQEPIAVDGADAGLAASMRALVVGEEAPKDMEFCPWRMVQKYPDWFIGKTNAPRVRPYFDEFHAHQEWDFYYLHSPSSRSTKPFIFVTVEQFVKFLGIINSRLDTKLAIPDAHAKRFSFRFGIGGTPRPKYLGRVHDAGSSASLLSGETWPDEGEDAMKYSEASWSARDKVQKTLDDIAKYMPWFEKKKKKSGVKQARNKGMRKDMMARLQDALGLKSWETSSTYSADLGFAVDKAPAFPPERAPVLVTVDVEVNEFAHDMVTEVGICILDAEKTKNVAPGEHGEAWWSLMETKHLRIQEYAFHTNRKFVNGCPDRFDFGTSDFVPNDQLFKTIDGIFDQYATTTSSTGEKIARDIVLVGHDLASDDKYLANIGYNMDAKNIVFRADSKDLHQHLRNADQGRGLSAVLFEFGIHAFNLHNAGNDAAYTLRAAVACVIADMKEQAKPKEAPQEAPQEKKSVEDTGYKSGDSECEDSKQDVTWVPGKKYYYGNDTDDDNLPMVM